MFPNAIINSIEVSGKEVMPGFSSGERQFEFSANEKVEVFKHSAKESAESRVAALLLSVVAIATKEVHIDCNKIETNEVPKTLSKLSIPSLPVERLSPVSTPSPRLSSLVSISEIDYNIEGLNKNDHPTATTGWNRLRAVSIDSPDEETFCDSPSPNFKKGSAIVSPFHSPVSIQMPLRKPTLRVLNKRKRDLISPPAPSAGDGIHNRHLQPPGVLRSLSVKTILRKKFSWKNYPELEAFLIANREEYLRHSALNYTVQQKQYNNRLTERLLELAGEHGYIFDQESFSFVTVRDRIRCYFKSYVQSAKKRGVVIGYAARKAGLMTEHDLEKSAHTAGRIVLPPH